MNWGLSIKFFTKKVIEKLLLDKLSTSLWLKASRNVEKKFATFTRQKKTSLINAAKL
jgi:hypothetical protein